MRPVLDAVTQHVDGAALGDLALQPGQEFAPRWAVFGQSQRFRSLGLGRTQEGRELDQIDAVLALVVVEVAAAPAYPAVAGGRFGHGACRGRLAGMAGECGADQAFEAAFGGVSPHFLSHQIPVK